jgi:hypothetical protein
MGETICQITFVVLGLFMFYKCFSSVRTESHWEIEKIAGRFYGVIGIVSFVAGLLGLMGFI